MKRRMLSLLLCAALCLGLLSSCGGGPSLKKPPKENQILADIAAFQQDGLPKDARFTRCEIVKRRSNPEVKQDTVYCNLVMENHFMRMQDEFCLTYNFYDEGGWILEDAQTSSDEEPTITYLDAEGKDMMAGVSWLKTNGYQLDFPMGYNRFIVASSDDSDAKSALMDRSGKLVTDFDFDRIDGSRWESPYTAAQLATKDGSVIIDENGQVCSTEYAELFYIGEMAEGEYWFLFQKGGVYGIINQKDVQVVIFPKFDSKHTSNPYSVKITNGVCYIIYDRFGSSSKAGIVNAKGEFIVPMTYSVVWLFADGSSFAESEDGQYTVFDNTGKKLAADSGDREALISSLPQAAQEECALYNEYDAVYPCERTSQVYIAVSYRTDEDPIYGLVKRNGEVLLDCMYDRVFSVKPGLVVASYDGQYAFYDWNGDQRSPFFPVLTGNPLTGYEIYGDAPYPYSGSEMIYDYESKRWGILPRIMNEKEQEFFSNMD